MPDPVPTTGGRWRVAPGAMRPVEPRALLRFRPDRRRSARNPPWTSPMAPAWRLAEAPKPRIAQSDEPWACVQRGLSWAAKRPAGPARSDTAHTRPIGPRRPRPAGSRLAKSDAPTARRCRLAAPCGKEVRGKGPSRHVPSSWTVAPSAQPASDAGQSARHSRRFGVDP